jgi:hypothetical protein
MSDTVRLRDADGNVHYTARGSQKAEELLRDDATEPPAQGDDPDTGTTGGGSGDGERTPRNTKRRDRGAGEA